MPCETCAGATALLSVRNGSGLNCSDPFFSFSRPTVPFLSKFVAHLSFPARPFYFLRDSTLFCDSSSMYECLLLLPSLLWFAMLMLVDTGACVTCVSASFVRRNAMVVSDVGACGSSPLTSACGGRLDCVGVVVLALDLGEGNTLRTKARVLENLSTDIILGRDVLRELGLCVGVYGGAPGHPTVCTVCSCSDDLVGTGVVKGGGIRNTCDALLRSRTHTPSVAGPSGVVEGVNRSVHAVPTAPCARPPSGCTPSRKREVEARPTKVSQHAIPARAGQPQHPRYARGRVPHPLFPMPLTGVCLGRVVGWGRWS